MDNIKRIEMIGGVFDSLKESVERYERYVELQNKRPPLVGTYDFPTKHSKTSIERRITFLREQLLVLSKSL